MRVDMPADVGLIDFKLRLVELLRLPFVANCAGDISFYNSAGSAAKFFWDASAESLGLGTSSPSAKLHVDGTVKVTGIQNFTVNSGGGSYITVNHTGNESWSWDARSGSGSDDYLDVGISGGTRAMSWHEDGRVGIGTSSPSTTLEVSGTTTTDAVDLTAIAKDISDTAVDVFVYDTSKDSDGGAWRKRTQGTSWYNETLNTSTRGARKEVPSVAVVSIQNTKLTIYDGDDPDMPMWIVFDTNANDMLGGASGSGGSWLGSVTALNGDIAVGSYSGHAPYLFAVSFVSEKGRMWHYTAGRYCYKGDISSRNDGLGMYVQDSSATIVHLYCRDVAMTVLPNAPIDADTGLPVPTIAVATDGGVSVIKDDGTVVDIVSGTLNHETPKQVKFVGDKVFWLGQNNYDDGWSSAFTAKIPSADVALNYNTGAGSLTKYTSFEWGTASFRSTNGSDILIPIAMGSPRTTALLETGENDELIFGGKGPDDHGTVVKVVENLSNPASGMIAQIASDFATGYQVGDIKLATLSSTDTTDVTGSELVTNGTFDSNTTGWSAINATLSVDANRLKIVDAGSSAAATQTISVTAGETYVISFNATAGTASCQAYVSDGTFTVIGSNISDGVFSYTYTAPSGVSSFVLGLNNTNGVTGQYCFFDNISVRLAEEDRSVNGNGLQVFGTVTKNPVATGADLVAYSGLYAVIT